MRRILSREHYESLDWRQTDTVLAVQNNVSPSVIFNWRRRLKKPRVPHGKIAQHQHLLRAARKWDWSQSVSKLASEKGISREWVYRIASKINRKAGVRAKRRRA